MQIVINIDEDLYTRLFDNGDIDAVDMLKACVAIRNGTPLPKGHGRLIDADYVTKDLNTLQDSFVINIPYAKTDAISVACCAPTILEADAVVESEG